MDQMVRFNFEVDIPLIKFNPKKFVEQCNICSPKLYFLVMKKVKLMPTENRGFRKKLVKYIKNSFFKMIINQIDPA